jgi:hypothetical protein
LYPASELREVPLVLVFGALQLKLTLARGVPVEPDVCPADPEPPAPHPDRREKRIMLIPQFTIFFFDIFIFSAPSLFDASLFLFRLIF